MNALIAAALLAAAPALLTDAPANRPAPLPARADGCSLAPRLPVGRKLVYSFTSTTTTSSAGGTPQTFQTDLVMRFSVLGTDEHGGASLSLLFDRVKVAELAADGKTASAEAAYTREEAEKPEDLPEDAPSVRRVARALAASAARLDVDRAGVVTAITGLEDAQAAANASGPMGGYLLGPLAANADRRTLSMIFRVDAPDEQGAFPARQSGDSWQLIDRVPMGAIAELVLTTSLTMRSCSPDEAHASGSVKTAAEAPSDETGEKLPADPGRPVIEIKDAKDELSLVWNPAKGILKKRERTSDITILAKIGSVRQNVQSLRTRSTIELLETSDAP